MGRIAADDDEWLAARAALLREEKALQAKQDELARRRRSLPWRPVRKAYRFSAEAGVCTLEELFGSASQLLVYHFMFHPAWEQGCKSCSFWADSYDRSVAHLAARDARLVAISRAPFEKLAAYRDRMGWTFPWYSSSDSDFNFDFDVSFTPDQVASGTGRYNYSEGNVPAVEMPGLSAFVKDTAGAVFHTYSTYSRGLDPLNATYQLMDVLPNGRAEDDLDNPMEWLKRRDEY